MRTMRWALPCLLLLPITTAMAANITVRPDRNPATLEESFHLIFEATGDLDGNPDFAPLKKDFRILSQSSISNVSIVNSRIHNIKTWKLSVFALRDGNIPIPPVAFGKDRSPAASVVVKRSRAGQAGQQQDDVFVELKVNPQQVYVQQQLMAKVKLYRAVGTPNATLTGPELESGRAITEHLEQDSKYETVIGNRRYHVLERNFAIYPQESGRLKFKPAVFQGQVDRNVGGRKQREHIIRRSAAVELNVKPIPAAFPGAHWLPAARVELSEQWSKDPSTMQVGEPVTRTLNITVTGLTASQLPVLEGALDGSFKQYPDQPQLETRKNATGSTAIRRDKVALIPVIAGDFTLPEIKLPWW
ncbi:MAG: BatD family protein, partial [Gammaproteobacteria bacterium]